jgi:hypothetical protein
MLPPPELPRFRSPEAEDHAQFAWPAGNEKENSGWIPTKNVE